MADSLPSSEPKPKSPGPVNHLNSPLHTHSPEKLDTQAKESSKVNGENHLDRFFVPQEDSYSSESDALVIDESVPKKKGNRTRNKKCKSVELNEKETENGTIGISAPLKQTDNIKIVDSENPIETISACHQIMGNNVENSNVSDFLPQGSFAHYCEVTENKTPLESQIENEALGFEETLPHSNPYFNESLFELSQQSQLQSTNHQISKPETKVQARVPQTVSNNSNVQFKNVRKVKTKPKNKEYAHYLGLQPAVQFKCSKCGKSGFESLITLQDHLIKCKAIAVTAGTNKAEKEKCSKFKLTRKVFLCSACGTYYENWNLYMHMLEFHKRYVCLYCLGMFSILDDLFNHIQTKHSVEPGIKNSLEEFYKVYNEPCYVVCCECSKLFTEQENFFHHKCVPNKTVKNKPKVVKTPIRPEQHVTGEGALNDSASDKIKNIVDSSKQIKSNSKEKDKAASKTAKVISEKVEKIKPLEDQETIESEVDKGIDNMPGLSNENKVLTDIDVSQSQNDKNENVCENMSIDEKSLENNHDDLNKESYTTKEREESEEYTEETNMMKEAYSEETLDSIDDTNEENRVDSPEPMETEETPPVETRKVPKLSLKIPKPGTYPEPEAEDSDYSDKMDINEDQEHIESENEHTEQALEKEKSSPVQIPEASSDAPTTELTELEQPLDKIDIRVLVQKCLKATAAQCIYCNHSRRIAVNGKQLGLHAIAQHRYSAVVKSITAEELQPERFLARIKESLDKLEDMYFNLESGLSDEAVTFSHIYECFQCYYTTNVHKELYLHNRKFHSKNLLLCIMCKSNFYSYSELICHLCPGMYVTEVDLQFRCCMCVSDDLPSSFRLMVHLRIKHNVCDVCLEMCHTQFKLSNHVWKHKLNHFCYRCGIAYRNKPDITRHLFWKHGTESILCKRCLQKKWPHMYHFCQPPAVFTCEECSLTFSKAVYLKVHKRLHTDEKKHQCTFEGCEEMFISKKLMMKHERKHWEPQEEEKPPEEEPKEEVKEEKVKEDDGPLPKEVEKIEEPPKPVKPIVDPINCLPELNLSESDSSDSEVEEDKKQAIKTDDLEDAKEETKVESETLDKISKLNENFTQEEKLEPLEVKPLLNTEPQAVIEETTEVIYNIWDNFKNYQASKDKLFGQDSMEKIEPDEPNIPIPIIEEEKEEEQWTWEKALKEHDYCAPPPKEEVVKDTSLFEVKPALDQVDRADHDYCFLKEEEKEYKEEQEVEEEKPKYVEKPRLTLLGGVAATAQEPILDYDDAKPTKEDSSSSSSSDSDSSSCSCGSNCSCSSSSDSDSSSVESSNSDSSTEEGRKKQQLRRQKRARQKEKSKNKHKKVTSPVKQETKMEVVTSDQPPVHVEPPIAESDLETTESDTDEEFYDKQPQIFARKLMEEKRAMILSQMGPDMLPNGSFFGSRPPTPLAGTMDEEVVSSKKKKKNKKRKKKKSEKNRDSMGNRIYSSTLIMPEEGDGLKDSTLPYYQHRLQSSPTVAPITLSLSKNSPVIAPKTPPVSVASKDAYSSKPELPNFSRHDSDPSLRASKRRRVPNKFYGYSSGEEEGGGPSAPKSRKVEMSVLTPASPKLVPPITIKTVPSQLAASPKQPTVEPITLKLPKTSKSRLRSVHSNNNSRGSKIKKPIPPIRLPTYLANRIPPRPPISAPLLSQPQNDSDSNDSENEQPPPPPVKNIFMPSAQPSLDMPPQLYCYCRCPYDEVSEMIGCDSNDCDIEWFHFECVGIMVPPKGQWFCPDCRKKKQRRELMHAYPHS